MRHHADVRMNEESRNTGLSRATEVVDASDAVPRPSWTQSSGEDSAVEDLVKKALLTRPGVTLRTRLIISYVAVFLVASGAVVAAWLIVSELEGKLEFIERADKFANEIQQCRRYEKNYLLYGTSLTKVLEHLYSARKTLSGAKAELGKIVGAAHWDELENDLEAYIGHIFELEAMRRNPKMANTNNKAAIEKQLRKYGSRIVDMAILMSKRERNSVRQRLYVMRQYFVLSLVLLLAVIVYMTRSLSKHFLQRLAFMRGVTERIGTGDFTPIMPVRKYRDEFTYLSVALNRMMHELNSRREQLVRAGKIAAVGTLTAGIAHEINNPVNNISLILESLIDKIDSMHRSERDRLLREAMTQSDRVTDIVKNLLEFSRASHPRLEEASIEEIVRKTERLVRNEMRLGGIKFAVQVRDQLPPLRVDKGGLQQVLLNLFLNAMQAMPDGGRLTVYIGLTKKLNEGRIDVKDTGKGIVEQDLDKIFDPFYTTKKNGEGTGLGLSVSHSIIEKHGGRIEVKSTLGQGTLFSIYLPVERPDF